MLDTRSWLNFFFDTKFFHPLYDFLSHYLTISSFLSRKSNKTTIKSLLKFVKLLKIIEQMKMSPFCHFYVKFHWVWLLLKHILIFTVSKHFPKIIEKQLIFLARDEDTYKIFYHKLHKRITKIFKMFPNLQFFIILYVNFSKKQFNEFWRLKYYYFFYSF